jgi:hypothetical protein
MKEGKTIRGVLLPVLIQDPAVAGESEAGSIVHPVIVKDSVGFTEGPTCRRVAVVDLDFNSGKLRRPATFDPRGSPYKGIAAYKVEVPTKRKTAKMPWARGRGKGVDIGELGSIPLDDPFMKVSVFGTVLRTLGLIQDPAVLGREIPWGFPGKQLLVVPRAAEMDNAFYHRDSRSLQFYYGSSSPGHTVYSGLSQDIVAHETTHAIIDGIASDLYDAISPESLAIHEGLADLTAALLSMRNRELDHRRPKPMTAEEIRQSSRFSRIAEEFGRWRGHGEALRDVCNTKTLDTNAPADCRIDSSSPHSTSEVLSGLLFAVFSALYKSAPDEPALTRKINRVGAAAPEGLRQRMAYAVNRTLGLAYRGLDWLPPGDASFADLVAAMLAADREFFPDDPRVREGLSKEAGLRGIPIAEASQLFKRVKLPLDADMRQKFVERRRKALGVPADARVKLILRKIHIYAPPLLPKSIGEGFDLKPDMSRLVSADTEHYLIKLAWWQREANEVEGWGKHRRYRSGATIVVEKGGRIRAVLQNRDAATATASRSGFLRLMLAGESRTPQIGPDGVVLRRGLRASLKNDTLSIRGAMQALHVAGGLE